MATILMMHGVPTMASLRSTEALSYSGMKINDAFNVSSRTTCHTWACEPELLHMMKTATGISPPQYAASTLHLAHSIVMANNQSCTNGQVRRCIY